MTEPSQSEVRAPHEPLARLFLRFLRFGLLAWGGPVAQIAMIRQELVEEERWMTRERFNRVLAVYQVLPGPEAHELCVYFGLLARGRVGGLLAGLGFMLPGFLLMFGLSWVYVTYGVTAALAPVFAGMKPAVAALIVRAIHRIAGHALTHPWLWAIAVAAGVASFAGVNFLPILVLAGATYAVARRDSPAPHAHAVMFLALSAGPVVQALAPTLPDLFGYGLRSGLLTFGGAYTVIPFLQHDAVVLGQWMSNEQFLDGLALSGILPAPLIIFATFVGYLGGGAAGALALTLGIFLPAFAFTLVGHDWLERLIDNRSVHSFLDGVTAGVVGLIAVTTIVLFRTAVTDWRTLLVFAVGLAALYIWKAKTTVLFVVLASGLLGWLLLR